MGGDWKQLLPVVLGGDEHAAFFASVKTLEMFNNNEVTIHRLTRNQRLLPGQERYLMQLKCWGTGIGRTNNRVKIDEAMRVDSEQQLIDFVFGNALQNPMDNIDQISGSALLCPLNDECFEFHDILLVILP